MTVASTAPTITYLENGTTVVQAVPFQFLAATDLVVERFDSAGAMTLATLGADYSVAGGDGATGSVTMAVAKAAGWRLRIRRSTARTQPTDYTPGDRFPAESHERALDRVTMIAQEIGAAALDLESRSLRVPGGDSIGELSKAVRAGKVLTFDALGGYAMRSMGDFPPGPPGEIDLDGLHFYTPEQFGAVGDNATDDTAALLELAAAVNAAGGGRVFFNPGKIYLLGHAAQLTMRFQGVNGLLIEGDGATLKTKNSGCPTASLGYNWGQINIVDCTNVNIRGLRFDGNRANQSHTAGHVQGYGFNAGIVFWTPGPHATEHVLIADCRFVDHGVLSGTGGGTPDQRGDGIWCSNGIKHVHVIKNVFERCGRWAFVIEQNAGNQAADHIYFRENLVLNEDRGVALTRPWGAIDIEDGGLNNSHIYIEDNVFEGTTQVAIGGFNAEVAECTVSDVYLRRNIWRLPTASGGTDVPFSLGNGNPGTGTYRSLERLFIEHNIVSWAGLPATFQVGTSAKLSDVFIRWNTFRAETLTGASELGLQFAYGGHMEGLIELVGNEFIGLGEGILNNGSWYADPTPLPLHLKIEGNRFRACYRSFNLSMVGSAAPAGSTLVLRDNVSENSRALLDGGAGESLNGGTPGFTLYGRERHDHINAHTNVTCVPTGPLPNCAVAGLPPAATGLKGIRGYVTDATATTFASTVAGGGGTNVQVICNGTNWVIG
ncbi:MAG: hypothetical protein QOG72_2470 [Sphingomonadales bacterium]|jgi:hypothetical protein|nr:hypothetical protein [Sphingomonadales bacterium]